MQHRFLTSGAIAAALLVLPLTGCGSDDSGGGGEIPADAGLVVRALDTLKFDKAEYTATGGAIKVAYVNDGSLQHTFVVEGHESDLKLDVDRRGEIRTGTLNLPKGVYTIYCDVPTHRSGGMEATLTLN